MMFTKEAIMRIVFVGAGSHIFTRRLVRDILSFPRLSHASIVLHDINETRLAHAYFGVQRIIVAGNYTAQVSATTNLEHAITDADIVITTIASPFEQWRHDIEIPAEYGVDLNIGDTHRFRRDFSFLRIYPAMQKIVRTIERVAPTATLLNYTNPMTMLCGGQLAPAPFRLWGFVIVYKALPKCWHAGLVPMNEINYTCAGINHMAWYLSYTWNGINVTPILRQLVKNPVIYHEEIVRDELFMALGYYTTESSGHHSEYNWWFRKRPELITQYCTPGTGWNPGTSYAALEWYRAHMNDWEAEAERERTNPEPIDLNPSNEYAAAIINALTGGDVFKFNGNVPNRNYITNLPIGACVEVPIYVDNHGLHPLPIGELPACRHHANESQ
jgi:alpha-galactosidase